MIVKTKFYCKSGSKYIQVYHDPDVENGEEIRFIEGKWYDGEYETWSDDKLNYWVVNEMNQKEKISIHKMNVIFEMRKDNIRDIKIEEILGEST